jgi:WD40 repeat protein
MRYKRLQMVILVFVFIATVSLIRNQVIAQSIPPGVVSVAWSHDGTRIAGSGVSGDGSKGLLRIWDAATGQVLIDLQDVQGGAIGNISWKPDGARLLGVSKDDVIRIWDTNNGQLVATLQSDQRQLTLAQWSPDGKRIATLNSGEYVPVRIWSAESDNYNILADAISGTFYSVAWSPDSRKLAIAAFGGVRVIDLLNPAKFPPDWIGPELLPMRTVAWSPDGTKVAGGSIDGPIYVMDVNSRQQLAILEGPASGGLAWSPDGKELASAGSDQTIRVWDIDAGKQVATFSVDKKGLWTALIAWSPYGGRLAYGVLVSSAESTAATAQSSLGSGLEIVVPSTSLGKLQAITRRCTKAAVQQQLLSRLDTTSHLPDFISEVKKVPKEQLPPVCAADLVAVAEALQK